ncbi:MAG: hypothetical protein PHS57_08675 [Alphaproteobacteria bacterium]|nr:hypothetical protein [Alphaproteobacteria bacterium]
MLDRPPFQYNVLDHYWFVGDNKDQVYSTKAKAYVDSSDPALVSWLESGGVITRIGSEDDLRDVLREQYPAGWPLDYQELLIVEALDATDVVANRCFKAGVPFTQDWIDYVAALRRSFAATEVIELPSPPLNEDGSVAYPPGS